MNEPDKREEVIKGLECCSVPANSRYCDSCPIGFGDGCRLKLKRAALALLKAQKPREITKEEWEQWKKTPDGKRDPLYFMWVGCTSGHWTMRPEDIHESAYLMGKIKIWNKKPSYNIMMQTIREAIPWN